MKLCLREEGWLDDIRREYPVLTSLFLLTHLASRTLTIMDSVGLEHVQRLYTAKHIASI